MATAFPTAQQARAESDEQQPRVQDYERWHLRHAIARAIKKGDYFVLVDELSPELETFLQQQGYQIQRTTHQRGEHISVKW